MWLIEHTAEAVLGIIIVLHICRSLYIWIMPEYGERFMQRLCRALASEIEEEPRCLQETRRNDGICSCGLHDITAGNECGVCGNARGP